MARIPAAERRADLVAAAVRVIAAHGVDGATTRRIAEDANSPLATLHYCFATKEALFSAVFDHVATQYREVLTRSDTHGDVRGTARALLCGVLQWYRDNPDFGAAIIELISWGQRQDGDLAQVVYTEAYSTMRAILVANAAATGTSIDPDTIDQLTYIVSALSDGFALNWLVFTGRDAAAPQIELSLGVLDTWMDAHLGDRAAGVAAAPEPTLRSLVSWVSVD
ncbi:TetR/AcrR family transcriptional regulator [Nocardia asteroides]|uniref:TetR/AcrR family transcriptional regulator n=1 Tax=Nocardia asteroides TaxID=1824 RepID=UPI00379C6D51